jgi:formylmethanofuran dehydrogenase subunit E
MDDEIVELATKLHGHLAPGIALGLRMCEIAMKRAGFVRGNKYLIGICETQRCLADAMQAATGCTLGHGSAFVEDYGKLALTIADSKTGKGVRVSLRGDAHLSSKLFEKWMMRLSKLSKNEEVELGGELLRLDEKWFNVEEVKVHKAQNFESSRIISCSICGDLVPESLSVDGKCKVCAGEAYYASL